MEAQPRWRVAFAFGIDLAMRTGILDDRSAKDFGGDVFAQTRHRDFKDRLEDK